MSAPANATPGATVFRDGKAIGIVKAIVDGKIVVESFPLGPRPINYYKPLELEERGLRFEQPQDSQ